MISKPLSFGFLGILNELLFAKMVFIENNVVALRQGGCRHFRDSRLGNLIEVSISSNANCLGKFLESRFISQGWSLRGKAFYFDVYIILEAIS